jgi:integrase
VHPDAREFRGLGGGSERVGQVALHVLSARQVQVAHVGDHGDGGGLFLRVTERGASWVYRYTAPDGRRREMGLGKAQRDTLAVAGKTLAHARDEADKQRAILRNGADPIESRKAKKADAQARTAAKKADAEAERTTLARVARRFHEITIEPTRTTKHAAQWIASLEQGVPPAIWHAPIDTIKAPVLLEALAALQARVPETASRVRQRLEVVFDDAIFHGLCADNPAKVIRRKLAERPKAKTKGKFAALPYGEVPAFMRALRAQVGIAARALEFAVLTAARTGEVIGATWAEIDTEAGVWCIPGWSPDGKRRMKGGEAHVVYLSGRALAILEAQREVQGDPYAFPSPTDRTKPLSNMAMLTLLRRMGAAGVTTVHGLCRSSFSTWANETAAARPDVIEACLAHRESDKVRAAYNRASFAAERRNLLAAWASYCNGEQPKTSEQSSAPVATVRVLPVSPVTVAA